MDRWLEDLPATAASAHTSEEAPPVAPEAPEADRRATADMGNLHIVVRKTLDWETAGYDELDSPFIQETARLWDSTFRLGYMACRARIKNIAGRAHRARPNVRVHSNSIDLDAVQTEDMVLLCDDDDWYSPHLEAALAAQNGAGRRELILWADGSIGLYGLRRVFLQKPRAPLIVVLRERGVDAEHGQQYLVRSNNYAIPGALLQDQPDILGQLWFHDGAERYVARTNLPTRRLHSTLSLVNRHPCSKLVLCEIMKQIRAHGWDPAPALRVAVTAWVRNHCLGLPRRLGWASPLIHQVRAVFREALGG